MISATFKKYEVVNPESHIVSGYAVLSGLPADGSALDSVDVRAALSTSSQHSLSAVEGSVTYLEDLGAGMALVRALMVPATRTLPASCINGMVSVSANMYMDDSDRLWNLSGAGTDKLLVAASAENPDELLEMMASCSSDQGQSSLHAMPMAQRAFQQHQSVLASLSGGDYVTYLRDDQSMGEGFVAAVSTSSAGDECLMIADIEKGQQSCSRAQVITVVPSDNVNVSDDVMLSESAYQLNPVKTLMDYYRRVYGHAPEYFKQLSAIIRGHAFA